VTAFVEVRYGATGSKQTAKGEPSAMLRLRVVVAGLLVLLTLLAPSLVALADGIAGG
jgi:hypothetical protein